VSFDIFYRLFSYCLDDQQNCTLTLSSWTSSKSALDYYAGNALFLDKITFLDLKVNMASFIPNEEWEVIAFNVYRHEYKVSFYSKEDIVYLVRLLSGALGDSGSFYRY
jgi:hypothetical protein